MKFNKEKRFSNSINRRDDWKRKKLIVSIFLGHHALEWKLQDDIILFLISYLIYVLLILKMYLKE